MRHLIALALLWAARLILPARGRHRRRPLIICAPAKPVQLTVPRHRVTICAPTAPIPALDLALSLLAVPPSRGVVPQYLMQWEQTPAVERHAILAKHAEAAMPRWQKTVAAEHARRRDTAEQQRTRRAAAFAAHTGLPDPVHWLDTITTGVEHTLAGAVA